jgi:hypothetical protein
MSLGACSVAESVPKAHAGECVILLHGLARTSSSMERMKSYLEKSGYEVANVDYPSREFEIEKLAPMAVEAGLAQCASMGSAERVDFVTHSLGGILVRYYFAEHKLDALGRVVMLAPPNQGSAAVDKMGDWPGFEWLNGPAGYQLGKGEKSIPLQLGKPQFEFAVIAGDESIDPVTSAVLENPDDGRVSVSDTYLEGMKDFRLVSASHAFIMQKNDVFELVKSFLETGKFPESTEGADDAG